VPQLTIIDPSASERTADVPAGRRLVQAIQDQGVNIGHRCGGWARCTTCRVEYLEGEPETMTAAEFERLAAKGLLGEYRLSCQVLTGGAMRVRVPITAETQGWSSPGPDVEPDVTPDPTTYPREPLEGAGAGPRGAATTGS
jgi:ferredoxin